MIVKSAYDDIRVYLNVINENIMNTNFNCSTSLARTRDVA